MESSTTLRHNGPDDDRPAGRTVRIPSRPEAAADARTTVARAAAATTLAPDRIDDLVIAVSEAVTNAIESHQRAGVTAPIEVECTTHDTFFEVEVRDGGTGFEPARLRVRPPHDDPSHLEIERGWGIQLMRSLVDDLVFDVTGPGASVRLRVALER
jgi:serine/threonine-protein kinase RsbW